MDSILMSLMMRSAIASAMTDAANYTDEELEERSIIYKMLERTVDKNVEEFRFLINTPGAHDMPTKEVYHVFEKIARFDWLAGLPSFVEFFNALDETKRRDVTNMYAMRSVDTPNIKNSVAFINALAGSAETDALAPNAVKNLCPDGTTFGAMFMNNRDTYIAPLVATGELDSVLEAFEAEYHVTALACAATCQQPELVKVLAPRYGDKYLIEALQCPRSDLTIITALIGENPEVAMAALRHFAATPNTVYTLLEHIPAAALPAENATIVAKWYSTGKVGPDFTAVVKARLLMAYMEHIVDGKAYKPDQDIVDILKTKFGAAVGTEEKEVETSSTSEDKPE